MPIPTWIRSLIILQHASAVFQALEYLLSKVTRIDSQFKGTVRRDLTVVESGTNHQVFL